MTTEKLEFYRCEICGNFVQVIMGGGPVMHCCGQEMKHLVANTADDTSLEKHVPVFLKENEGMCEIRVGELPHPMLNEHYIMFIEVISNDKNKMQLQYLYPEQEPKMLLTSDWAKATAKEFCNIHGLWEGHND